MLSITQREEGADTRSDTSEAPSEVHRSHWLKTAWKVDSFFSLI